MRSIEERLRSDAARNGITSASLPEAPVRRSLPRVVSIDLTEKAIDSPIRKKANLILNHHPCIFPKSKGLSRVTDASSPSGSWFAGRSRTAISVAAYHTNFDQCALEVVQTVANGLGVIPRGRLIDKPRGALSKLVVFVPATHAEAVREAICEAGAGHIGNYDSCTFGSEGKGTFRGNDQSRPFLGRSGQLEHAPEVRLGNDFSVRA